MRPSGRTAEQLRTIHFDKAYTKYAEGSVLISYGDTKVLCNASMVEGVPRFLKGKRQGWLTAEYSMLPRATSERTSREVVKGCQSGRSQEIQRLIGRSLRSILDLRKLADYTIHVDCDVLQADGGTRTAAISGACVAVIDALQLMQRKKLIQTDPLLSIVAAVSVGIYQGVPVLDLDYQEDSCAETDMNVVMTEEEGQFIEIQGTAEKKPFSLEQQQQMLVLAQKGISQIIQQQQLAIRA